MVLRYAPVLPAIFVSAGNIGGIPTGTNRKNVANCNFSSLRKTTIQRQTSIETRKYRRASAFGIFGFCPLLKSLDSPVIQMAFLLL